MIIRLEPSGTHVHKGFLKIRLDLVPEPTDLTYSLHHVYIPVIPLGGYPGKMVNGEPADPVAYQVWLDGLPHIWRVNSCYSHLVTVPETVSLEDAMAYASQVFTREVTATLDNYLIRQDSAHYVSPLMAGRGKFGTLIQTQDTADLIASVNQKLSSLVLSIGKSGGQIIDPQSIVIGPGATNRTADFPANTCVDHNIAADGSGTLTTWELWFATGDAPDVEVATFVVVSGNNLSTRDSEAIGTVAAGSKYSGGGFSTDVITGDWAGVYFSAGTLERDAVGLGWWRAGDNIPCTNATFTGTSRTFSIYATGATGATVSPLTVGLQATASSTFLGYSSTVSRLDLKTTRQTSVNGFGYPIPTTALKTTTRTANLGFVSYPTTSSLKTTGQPLTLGFKIIPGQRTLNLASLTPRLELAYYPSTLDLKITAQDSRLDFITIPGRTVLNLTPLTPRIDQALVTVTLDLRTGLQIPVFTITVPGSQTITPETLALIINTYAAILFGGNFQITITGRYGGIPTEAWISGMTTDGRYASSPTEAWVNGLTKSGRYGV